MASACFSGRDLVPRLEFVFGRQTFSSSGGSTSNCLWLKGPTASHRPLRQSRHSTPSLRSSPRLNVSCTALEQDTEDLDGFKRTAALGLEELLTSRSPLLEAQPVVEVTPRQAINRRIKKMATLTELRDLILLEGHTFDSVNTSHALLRLAKMHRTCVQQLMYKSQQQAAYDFVLPALRQLDRLLLVHLPDFEPRDVASCLWSYAVIGHHSKALFDALCTRGEQLVASMKPADYANIMYAFGLFGHHHLGLLRSIPQAMLNHVHECKPHEISQVVWALARLNIPQAPGKLFLEAVVDTLEYSMEQYGCKELSNVLWALAKLNHRPSSRVLQCCEAHLLNRLDTLNSQDVGNVLWAFARHRYKAVGLLDALPMHVAPQLHLFKPQELSCMLHGYTMARHFHRALLDAVAPFLVAHQAKLSHQDVAICIWAYGIFQHCPTSIEPEFLDTMAAAALRRVRHLHPQGLGMVAKGMAALQHRCAPLMEELARVSEQKLPSFRPDEMSHLLYGLSYLRYRDKQIYFACERQCIRILEEPRHPFADRRWMNHKVLNSIVASCCRAGYIPWTLIDFAESRGMRIRQPGESDDDESSSDDSDDILTAPPRAWTSPPHDDVMQQRQYRSWDRQLKIHASAPKYAHHHHVFHQERKQQQQRQQQRQQQQERQQQRQQPSDLDITDQPAPSSSGDAGQHVNGAHHVPRALAERPQRDFSTTASTSSPASASSKFYGANGAVKSSLGLHLASSHQNGKHSGHEGMNGMPRPSAHSHRDASYSHAPVNGVLHVHNHERWQEPVCSSPAPFLGLLDQQPSRATPLVLEGTSPAAAPSICQQQHAASPAVATALGFPAATQQQLQGPQRVLWPDLAAEKQTQQW